MITSLDHDRWIIQIEQFSGPYYSCDYCKQVWGGTLEPCSLYAVIKPDMETYGVETLEERSVMGKVL